jgi:hypothetical protein
MKLAINMIIGVIYFWIFVALGWGKSGGDIVVMILYYGFFLIHLIILLIKIGMNWKKQEQRKQYQFGLLGLIFALSLNILAFKKLNDYREYRYNKSGGDGIIEETNTVGNNVQKSMRGVEHLVSYQVPLHTVLMAPVKPSSIPALLLY